ncbi:MAG: hypothetical protein P4L57_13845 [Rhizomicrobium sp.]|nr:hypothetical protein [Rhizomicrobium sp.]
MLVTIAAFSEAYEAHLLRGRLQAEGVSVFIAHEMTVANMWHRSVAFGGVKVQVPYDQIETAREIERDCRLGVYKELLSREVGDLDDATCPRCGCLVYQKRRPFPRAALAVFLSLYLGVVLPPLGWIYRCESCLREYRAPHRPLSPQKIMVVAAVIIATGLSEIALLHWIHSAFGCPGAMECF